MDAYDLISAIIIILIFIGLYFTAILGIGLKQIENDKKGWLKPEIISGSNNTNWIAFLSLIGVVLMNHQIEIGSNEQRK